MKYRNTISGVISDNSTDRHFYTIDGFKHLSIPVIVNVLIVLHH